MTFAQRPSSVMDQRKVNEIQEEARETLKLCRPNMRTAFQVKKRNVWECSCGAK